MANELDEMNPVVNEAGRDVNVIEKQLPVKTGVGSVIFEICLWVCGILPGVIFQIMKIKAKNYFQQLQQKIQAEASNIDNYLEQRVQILQNVAPLLEKAIELDKDVMKTISAYRGGINPQAASSRRSKPILNSRRTPPLPMRCNRTPISRRKSLRLALSTTTAYSSGTETSSIGLPR